MGLGSSGLANFANTEPGRASGLAASTHQDGEIGDGIGGSILIVRFEPEPEPSPSP